MRVIKIILSTVIYFLALVGALLISFLIYIYFTNPFGIVDILLNRNANDMTQTVEVGNNTELNNIKVEAIKSDNPLLNDKQEKLLKDIGIDPATIPTEITPETQACLIGKVGESRAQEIISGATPTTFEILKASTCLK